MATNFNFVAPIYDCLVRLVFGKKLWEAQRAHLSIIKPNDHVLIIGGGTGRILDWLHKDCHITYVEPSSQMMKRAKKRRQATFIQTDFASFSSKERFDVIVCPFVLDVFPSEQLGPVIKKIKDLLKPDGHLVVTDFKETDVWHHRLLLRLMFVFFSITTNLKTQKLAPIQTQVLNASFDRIKSASFKNGLIFSDLYKNK
jgi:ubiquinone/menaquinone biosynthesis C-methylase UbiE